MVIPQHPPRCSTAIAAVAGVRVDALARELHQRLEPGLAALGFDQSVLFGRRLLEEAAATKLGETVADQLAQVLCIALQHSEDVCIRPEPGRRRKIIGRNDPVDHGAQQRNFVRGKR